MADRGPLGDIAFAAVIFALLFGGLYAYAGGWPPMVSVISDSMSPHMEKGDLVLIQGLNRGDVKTYEGPESLNYTSFEERGNVIVYRPEGEGTPTIHRAIRWVEQGEPMWHNGPAAPWAGYITLGDNNQGVLDQMAPSICYEQPVKKEWIVGIARFRIPFLGYIRSVIPW